MSEAKGIGPQCMPHRAGAEAYARDNNISQDVLERWWVLSLEYGWNSKGAKFQTWRESLDDFVGFNAKMTEQSNRMIAPAKQETQKNAIGPKERKSIFGQPLHGCVNFSFDAETIPSLFRMSDDMLGHAVKQWIVEKLCKASLLQEEATKDMAKPEDEKIPGTFTQWEVCEMAPNSTCNVICTSYHDWKANAVKEYSMMASEGKIVRAYEVLHTPYMATWHDENNHLPLQIKTMGGEVK